MNVLYVEIGLVTKDIMTTIKCKSFAGENLMKARFLAKRLVE